MTPDPTDAELAYLENLGDDALEGRTAREMLRDSRPGTRRICCVFAGGATKTLPDIEALVSSVSPGQPGWTVRVCIIEDIDVRSMVRLGVAWELEHRFCRNHVVQHHTQSLSNTVVQVGIWKENHGAVSRKHSCIKGMLSHVSSKSLARNATPRQSEHSPRYGWQVATRMSYYRIDDDPCKTCTSFVPKPQRWSDSNI